MGLLSPWKSKNPKRRLKWVTKGTKLIEMGLNIELSSLKLSEKFFRITLKLAKEDENADIRKAAERELGCYAAFAINTDIKNEAFDQIKDEAIFSEIIINSSDKNIRKRAAKKLTEINNIEKIAQNAKFANVRVTLLKKITDQKIFIKIAKNDHDNNVRCEAIKSILDPEIILEFAKSELNTNIRKTALNMISDQTVLTEFAINDDDSEIRKAALMKINDAENLKDIILNGKYRTIREKAELKLKNQNASNLEKMTGIKKFPPTEEEWYELVREIKENTNLNNPRLGKISWDYGNSQTEIIASYKDWKYKATMNGINNHVSLEIKHSKWNRSKQVSDRNNELSNFLYQIF